VTAVTRCPHFVVGGSGLAPFRDGLTDRCHGSSQTTAVAIETPRNAMVGGLIARSFVAAALNGAANST
jgi:hypothetical protein